MVGQSSAKPKTFCENTHMTIFFSVVIPLYNKADTIERAIRSVYDQTYHDFELIVVNDGSTDDSRSIVETLSREFPLRLVDKPNGGVSSARNAGAQVARGEYIALLDGDDVWDSNHLSCLKKIVQKYPGLGIIGTGYREIRGECRYFTIPWPWIVKLDVYDACRYAQRIHTSSVAIRKETWIRVGGFNEKLRFYEDFEFFFRIGMVSAIGIYPAASSTYMSDSQLALTREVCTFSTHNYPQIAFVDDSIAKGRVTPGLLRWAIGEAQSWYFRSVLSGDFSKYELLKRAYPTWAGTFRARRWPTWGAWIVCQMWRQYYIFRNHLVIWKTGIIREGI